jgi:hypothetical protein
MAQKSKGDGASRLFTIRLRFEEIAAGRLSEYLGEVKRVVSGATRHFRSFVRP